MSHGKEISEQTVALKTEEKLQAEIWDGSSKCLHQMLSGKLPYHVSKIQLFCIKLFIVAFARLSPHIRRVDTGAVYVSLGRLCTTILSLFS